MGTLQIRSRLLKVILSLLLLRIVVAASLPGVTRKQFDNDLEEVQYFDDSDIVLVSDPVAGVVWRSEDAGTTWDPIEALGEGEVVMVAMNPHDNKVAIALGKKNSHWITKDRGEKWRKFELKDAIPSFRSAPALSFHAQDSDRIIMNTRTRDSARAVFTLDGFESEPKILRKDALRCLWAKETDLFDTGSEEQNRKRVMCVAGGKYASSTDSQRLLISDHFFDDEEFEPYMEDDRAVQGIVSVVAAKGFVLAARQTTGTTEMALYVTTDTKKWHRANFGQHQLKEDGYTVMDSTNYSLQVDVRTGSMNIPPMGALFTSNSHGYNFVQNEEYTNRNPAGFVDFEKVTNIQGIVLVNIVANVEAVQDGGAPKKLISQISFDDGRKFQDLKTRAGARLHLHSVTDASNVGSIYSSTAPGILMGVGNTGESMRPYEEGDLWTSDDAGKTWIRALGGPHKYEFGDQGSLLVAVYDGSEIGKISWSENHGEKWQPILLKDIDMPEEFRVRSLTTSPDSTTTKFIMKATTGRGSEAKLWLYTIDFSKLDKRECKDDDFERWYALVNEDGKPKCVMGHTQSFRRRKANADCFVGVKFKDPQPEYDNEPCTCTIRDYECEVGFRRSEDRETCIPDPPRRPVDGQCEGDKKTYKDSNGFRKIPGNQCRKGDKDFEGEIERKCDEYTEAPSNGEITHTFHEFPSDGFREYYYLERSGTSSDELFGFADETIVVGTGGNMESGRVYISHDHGKKWRPILEKEDIRVIYPHRHFKDRVYFVGNSKTVFYSASRGKSTSSFEAPGMPVRGSLILRFHPKHDEWLIWLSCTDNDSPCTAQAHYTRHNGAAWAPLLKAVGDCEFVWLESRKTSEEAIYCAQHKNEDRESALQLVSSQNWFDDKKVHFEDMINFATMSEFIIVATKEGKDSEFLAVDSSIDGENFAGAKFPANLQVPHSSAYTVLDSSTHSIFLHVTINPFRDQEYGTIIKSNSNGTSYTMSLSNVNRNSRGFVDFEKIGSMEGVAIVNVVANVDAMKGGEPKQLQTRITHNDGGAWDPIAPPEKDAEGKKYECPKTGTCALHLHGYTERTDPRDTYASASAVGFMLGIGNVGAHLGPERDGNTFITSDGGLNWRTAKNGQYMWEFGDQGGIIVIVSKGSATKVVYYSLDEGFTWKEYQFSDHELMITDITTVPSDTSMNFLLWGIGRERQGITINLDFSGLAPEPCKGLDNPDSADSDYTTFTPRHPHQKNNCLFGHVWQYYRKKPSARCHNGLLLKDKALYKKVETCACTREDFECDYNYERQNDGSCKLVPGHDPISKEAFCKQYPEAETYYTPTGYRRLPLTTCENGMEFDVSSDMEPCPGKEEQYKKKHGGISGAGLFFAIVLPIAAAIGIGYWIFTRFEGKFGMGRIRLGDSGGMVSGARSAASGDWTKYPIMAVSAVVAVVMAVPMVVTAVVRSVRERVAGRRSEGYGYNGPYRSRGSFARGRRDYASVGGQDESDLLGEDSDDDA